MNSLILLFILLAEEPPVDSNDQVLPILSDKCFGCHGKDKNKIKGELQLNCAELATKAFRDGHFAIVPGHDDLQVKTKLIRQSITESVMTTVTETKR